MAEAVRHVPEEGRFEIPLEEGEAYMAYEGPEEGTVDFTSTFVSPGLRGGGLAERIVLAALRWAREEGLAVVPTCPYVRETMTERHPEFADLVVDGDGSGA